VTLRAADDFKALNVLHEDLVRAQTCAVAVMGLERPRDLGSIQADCPSCTEPDRECVCCAKKHGGWAADCRLCCWDTGLPCPPR
jgi:hypothetical protein